LGALKGNQSGLLTAVQATFQPQETSFQINKGHGRIEKRTVSISQNLTGIPDFPGLKTLIRVESERHVYRANIIESSTETRYYVTSLTETAQLLKEFEAIGGSKTKFIMSVMSRCGEDACRIRTALTRSVLGNRTEFCLEFISRSWLSKHGSSSTSRWL